MAFAGVLAVEVPVYLRPYIGIGVTPLIGITYTVPASATRRRRAATDQGTVTDTTR